LSWPPSEAAIQASTPGGSEVALDSWVKPRHDKGLLRWEPSRGGELFPHLYAHLPLTAVRSATPVELADDGTPIIPAGLPS
jgi:uncharacterized protein (DUF952 family)